MLTIFTAPKAFLGDSGRIQQNAITSWARLEPACEIILLGNEAGLAGFAAGIGARHEPGIRCSPGGVPLLDSVFEAAEQIASHPLLCFINADILLLDDFMPAVRFLRDRGRPFMMTGQRWNTDVPERIDFSQPDWAGRLRKRAARLGQPQPYASMDYFVYPRGIIRDQPPLLTGRGYNDNWMVYRALASGADVVDASPCVLDIHQNHDYGHVGDGLTRWQSEQSRENRRMVLGQMKRYYSLLDAGFLLGRSPSGYMLLPSPGKPAGRPMSLGERHGLISKTAAGATGDGRAFFRQLLAESFWQQAREDWQKMHAPGPAWMHAVQAAWLMPESFSPRRICAAAINALRRKP